MNCRERKEPETICKRGCKQITRRECMEENAQTIGFLSEVIRARRTIRSFTNDVPPEEGMKEILQSAIFAPFGRATDLPPKEIRKIFIFSHGTENMNACADTTVDKGGGSAGFRPHDLLEAALASCLTMSLRMCAEKYDIPFSEIRTKVSLNGQCRIRLGATSRCHCARI